MGKRILVVDDDAAFAEMIQLALVGKSYEVETCLQAALAYRKIKEWQPDLVTLDILMPGRSGWEVINQMQMNPETVKIPILITTGIRGDLVADEAMLLKGMRYEKLYKPFDLDELYVKVDSLIGKANERA